MSCRDKGAGARKPRLHVHRGPRASLCIVILVAPRRKTDPHLPLVGCYRFSIGFIHYVYTLLGE